LTATGAIENTIADSGQYPIDVAVMRNVVAIANIYTFSYGSGSVSVYDRRGRLVRSLVPTHDFIQGIGITFDSVGDCFFSYNDYDLGGAYIVEWTGCKGKAAMVRRGLGFAGDLAFDGSGNLYYSDQLNGIYKCSGTTNCAPFAYGFRDPLAINFDSHWKHLWVADVGTATVYALNPTTGATESSFVTAGGTSDPPFGIAPNPGAHV
jgi:DNA-binding beta-propeller fold protein YncE